MSQTGCSSSLELNNLYSHVHLQFRWAMVSILILTSTVTWWTTKNLITVFRDIQTSILALVTTKTGASRVVYDKNCSTILHVQAAQFQWAHWAELFKNQAKSLAEMFKNRAKNLVCNFSCQNLFFYACLNIASIT